ncbi:MAG: N-acetylmuramoyl-L-alanine amidase [Bacteroidetes bacterium]|nr:MAG: N-acetylmuramoyl-L-alanine amidase [Bacteroidota bacterium]
MRYILKAILLIYLIQFSNLLSAQTYKKIDRVVIDAGHGGKDPGTVGKKSKEKDIALKLALKVGNYIEQNLPDVKVIYTRKTDVFVELYKRAKIANKEKADVFISIHCNATTSPNAVGTETWIIGATKGARNLAIAQKENAAILYEADHEKRYDNFDPNSPESYIIFELFQSAYREQSENLATLVQKQFSTRLHRVDRGVKEAGFLVLVNTTMPSILVEAGFLSNPAEEKYLMSEKGQNEIASGIYRAFKEYKHQMEQDDMQAQMEAVKRDSILAAEKKAKANVEAVAADNNQELIFGVQFMTSKKVFTNGSAELKGMKDVWRYQDKGYNKYVSGRFKSIDEANTYAKKVRANGFSDAFVVAFIDGKRISKRKAIKMMNK